MKTTNTPNHRKLTAQQLATLQTLFTFRFATSNLLLQTQLKPISIQALNKRLRTLHTQNFIAKREPDKQSFGNQHAMWCLAAGGIAALKEHKFGAAQALRNVRKDMQASDKFAHHSIGIFAIHNALRARYKDQLQFLTRSSLYGKDAFPDPLPGAFITIKSDKTKQFLLEYVDNSRPQKFWKQRISQLVDYIGNGEWEETNTDPALLFVCATPWLERRVTQWSRQFEEEGLLDDMQMFVATVDSVTGIVEAADFTKSSEAKSGARLVWTGY